VHDDEILSAMRRHEDPAFATSELAEWFDMSDEGIRNRLNQLESEGQIVKKKPSEKTVLWWHHEDERDPELDE
jgi:DNA-binding GntR family transcriptional regulator